MSRPFKPKKAAAAAAPSNTETESSDTETEAYGTKPVRPSYLSEDVPLPPDFLSVTAPPPDAKPVTITPIDFSQTVLPQYKGLYAVVLDNVLSPGECDQLLRMAEASVPEVERLARRRRGKKSGKTGMDKTSNQGHQGPDEKDPWRPALVHIGGGLEVLTPDYRNSDRIIWDQQEVVDRLWARCAQAPGLADQLARLTADSPALPFAASRRRAGATWRFARLNKRMRFLKYQGGQFFRPHCDAQYQEVDNGKVLQTWFTVHLYLNDSKAEVGDAAELVGGATSFLSTDHKRKLDVDPRAGRVLIFQHSRLCHSGDDVAAGTKYTMRTDILYERVDSEEAAATD